MLQTKKKLHTKTHTCSDIVDTVVFVVDVYVIANNLVVPVVTVVVDFVSVRVKMRLPSP